MTTTRDWLGRLAKRVVGKFVLMENTSRNVLTSSKETAFLKRLTWQQYLLILLVLPWGALAALYVLTLVVYHTTLFPHSVPIRVWNGQRKLLWISYVGIDGRRLSDQFVSSEQGLGEMVGKGIPNAVRLSSGNFYEWESGKITPNVSHRLALYASSPAEAPAKFYSCEVFIPRSLGMLLIELNEQNKVNCEYSISQHFSILF